MHAFLQKVPFGFNECQSRAGSDARKTRGLRDMRMAPATRRKSRGATGPPSIRPFARSREVTRLGIGVGRM